MCWLGVWFTLFLCFLIAHFIKGDDSLSSLKSPDSSDIRIIPNHTEAFSTFRRNSDQNGKPSFALSFNSMSTENGKVSFFNTALQRTIKVNHLKVKFYRYSSGANISEPDRNETSTMKYLFKQCFERLLSKADIFSEKKTDYSVNFNVDFNNISKLSINDFQYNRFIDEELDISLKCKKAETCYSHSNILLRGHVVIEIGSGSKLETNQVIWDIQDETFQAKGTYFLNQNGVLKKGKDICLDMNLKELQKTKYSQGEKLECFTKSQ